MKKVLLPWLAAAGGDLCAGKLGEEALSPKIRPLRRDPSALSLSRLGSLASMASTPLTTAEKSSLPKESTVSAMDSLRRLEMRPVRKSVFSASHCSTRLSSFHSKLSRASPATRTPWEAREERYQVRSRVVALAGVIWGAAEHMRRHREPSVRRLRRRQ